MTIEHKIYPELGIVISRWSGEVSDPDLDPGYRKLYDDPAWKPGFHEIADLRAVDLSGISAEGFYQLNSLVQDYVKGQAFKTAIIVSPRLSFGIARMYEGIAAESPELVRVFLQTDKALRWIGVSSKNNFGLA